ncbi:MAG: hypothetical protein CSA81_07140 [Acidobacteria bacterium]|nr:MAG: hypothetical protein CSA81_07140 [Acidobacteriota bacterium]
MEKEKSIAPGVEGKKSAFILKGKNNISKLNLNHVRISLDQLWNDQLGKSLPNEGVVVTKKRRLLIVDDDLAILDVMWAIAYQIEGIIPEKTNQPLNALELLKTGDYQFLLTDLDMPDLDGLELLHKAKEINPDMAVTVVTGFGDLETAIRAINAGAYEYVHKPFRPQELTLVINNMVERQEFLDQMKEQESELIRLKTALNQSAQKETELQRELEELQVKLEAIGISTGKGQKDILQAINKAASKKIQHSRAQDLSRELTNLTELLDDKKISAEEFSKFRQYIIKKAYGE